MRNKELLTVVTLTRDSARFIESCIQSFLKAKSKCGDKRLSHLVVDGHSTDDTLEIVRNLSPESTIMSLPPTGLYNAINYAIEHVVKTPFVTYLHSDDEIDENYLSHMMKELQRVPDQNAVIVGTVSFIDECGVELYSRHPPFYLEKIQQVNNLIFHPNAVYPTNLERRFPYREDKYQRASDTFHILEIMKVGKHVRMPKAVYKFRISDSSLTLTDGQSEETQKPLFSRLYIHLFETNRMKRLKMKMQGKSYWKF